MSSSEEFNGYSGPSYFPDGKTVPDLLTEEETVQFLRLDTDGPSKPELTLKYYRDEGLLVPTRVGKRNRYLKTELLKFLNKLTYRKRRTTE